MPCPRAGHVHTADGTVWWAVGASGALLHRTEQGWETVDTGLEEDLNGVVDLGDGRLAIGGGLVLVAGYLAARIR